MEPSAPDTYTKTFITLAEGSAQQQKVLLSSSAHLSVDDGTVSVDGVGIELDPQVGGANRRQLGRSDRDWRF